MTLSGTVNSREEKRRAEDLSERVSGVKDVSNNLRVVNERSQSEGTTQGRQSTPGQQGSKH